MKIIDKVKTIFWDNEEEIEDDVEIEQQPKKKETAPSNEMINERDLFKTETSFKFPVVFTEEDFAKTIPPEKIVDSSPKKEQSRKQENFQRREQTRPEVKETKKEEAKTFRVSPAISPIYGVLDKNYKKEDIKTKDTRTGRLEENEINFENIRKKAYGTLADDIEKTLTEDNKLKSEIDEKLVEKVNPNKNITIEEAIGNYDNLGEVYSTDNNTEEDIIKLKKDKKNVLEDTIEQDLFNLIDSMYDKEGEENDGTSE